MNTVQSAEERERNVAKTLDLLEIIGKGLKIQESIEEDLLQVLNYGPTDVQKVRETAVFDRNKS